MRFLIIEDEPAAALRLKRMITTLRPDATCAAELRSVEEAVLWFAQHDQSHIDLAFADIQLGDGLSFEIFSHIEVTCPVIFTTAYDQYAIRAFQVHAIDYLLKPLKMDQLEAALGKFGRIASAMPTDLQAVIASIPGAAHRQRFVVKTGRALRIVPVQEISYFLSENKITYCTTHEGRRYALDVTLDQLDTELDPAVFYRANRQCIVHIQGIGEMHAHSRARIRVVLRPPAPHEVIVSTEKSGAFKSWLQGREAQ